MFKYSDNIKDYDIHELQTMLELNDPYTLEDIVDNDNILQERILINSYISDNNKRRLITFLKKVKKKLITYKQHEYSRSCIPTEQTQTQTQTLKHNQNQNQNHITINSASLNADQMYVIPTGIDGVTGVEINKIVMPNICYTISTILNNNYMYIQWNHNLYNVTIPDGTYCGKDMQMILNKTLNNINIPTNHPPRVLGDIIQTVYYNINRKMYFYSTCDEFTIYFNRMRGSDINKQQLTNVPVVRRSNRFDIETILGYNITVTSRAVTTCDLQTKLISGITNAQILHITTPVGCYNPRLFL
jgi:hypothetical protein